MSDPVIMYIDALVALFGMDRAFLRSKELLAKTFPENTKATLQLGWFDKYFWYLLPNEAWQAVCEFYLEQGKRFGFSDRQVRAALVKGKYSLPHAGRLTCQLWIDDKSYWTLRVFKP